MMTLRSHSLFLLSCVVCVGLFVAGCDSGGDTGNEPPTADFDVSVEDYTADFTNTSTDPDGEIVSSEWEFGDGETSSDESPAHTYEANDTYEVTLTVTDDEDATNSKTMDVSTALTTFDISIENVSPPAPILKSDVFAGENEVGTTADGSGSLTPGEAYEFSFTAAPNEIPGTGMQLSLATMFAQSNDIFYAFAPGGVPLYDQGEPIGLNGAVDLTDQVAMWDAGTEQDQTPGEGSNQAPRQDTLNQGPDDSNDLVLVDNSDGGGQPTDDGFEYPQVSESIQVTIESQQAETGGHRFTVRIENAGGATQVNGAPMVVSPGTYAVHWDNLPNGNDLTYPQFAPGEDVTGTGIERIAEDGRPAGALDSDPNMPPGNHARVLASLTGVTVPLSPGGYAAHSDQIQLFNTGEGASPGVEAIAEDGNPTTLVGNLQGNEQITDGGAFARPDGAEENGPLAPTPPDAENNSYTVTVDASQGDRLSIGTMYVQSNDKFYAFQPEGIPLFTDDGTPISGDQTDRLRLYDAGTEVDEEPGVGLNQAPRQSDSNIGDDEGGNIVRVDNTNENGFLVDDGFPYAPILDTEGRPTIIKVTVTPQ